MSEEQRLEFGQGNSVVCQSIRLFEASCNIRSSANRGVIDGCWRRAILESGDGSDDGLRK